MRERPRRLPTAAHILGRGQMTVMERLFASGSAVEFSAVEDAADEKQILRMVQRELAEADEANLLEEEDMHVFDREPLADRLLLVSCNSCKKPIKSSQYIMHAERCGSVLNLDDATLELDGGSGHRRPPRKARKKLLSPQDNPNTLGDTDRSQSQEVDDVTTDSVIAPGSNFETQMEGITVSRISQAPRKPVVRMHGDGMPDSEDCDGVGQSNAGYADIPASLSKRTKISSAQSCVTAEDLDGICGVKLSDYTSCLRPLTCKGHSESLKRAVRGRSKPFDLLLNDFKIKNARDLKSQEQDAPEIPVPLATKIYYFRHHHQMRAVLGHLFHEALTRASSSSGTSPASTSEEQGASYGISQNLSADNTAHESQQRSFSSNQMKTVKDNDTNAPSLSGLSTKPTQLPYDIGIPSAQPPTSRTLNQQQDSKLGIVSSPVDIAQPGVLRSRVMQASQLLGISPGEAYINSLQVQRHKHAHIYT